MLETGAPCGPQEVKKCLAKIGHFRAAVQEGGLAYGRKPEYSFTLKRFVQKGNIQDIARSIQITLFNPL